MYHLKKVVGLILIRKVYEINIFMLYAMYNSVYSFYVYASLFIWCLCSLQAGAVTRWAASVKYREFTSTHVQFFCLSQGILIQGILFLYWCQLQDLNPTPPRRLHYHSATTANQFSDNFICRQIFVTFPGLKELQHSLNNTKYILQGYQCKFPFSNWTITTHFKQFYYIWWQVFGDKFSFLKIRNA